jgi:hypothetical protein
MRAAKRQMKDGLALGISALPVADGHRQLVQIGQQRERAIVHKVYGGH